MKSAVIAASSIVVRTRFTDPSPCGAPRPRPMIAPCDPRGIYATRAERKRGPRQARAPPPRPAPWPRPRPAAPRPRRASCPPSSAAATAPSRSATATGNAGASRSTSDPATPPGDADDEAGDLHQLGHQVRRALRQPALRDGGAQHHPALLLHLLHRRCRRLPPGSPRRAAAAARRRDAHRHQGHLAQGPALERHARRPDRPRPLHGPRPRGRGLARRLLQLRRPRRGDPRPQPQHAPRTPRPDLALPLPGRQAPAAQGKVPRRPAGRRRHLPVRAALRHPRGARRRPVLARPLGPPLPLPLRPAAAAQLLPAAEAAARRPRGDLPRQPAAAARHRRPVGQPLPPARRRAPTSAASSPPTAPTRRCATCATSSCPPPGSPRPGARTDARDQLAATAPRPAWSGRRSAPICPANRKGHA